MKIYTHTGDDGTTSLAGGRRVSKYCPRVEAYGSVDELIAWVGLLRSQKEISDRNDFLIYLQDQLMICAAALANDPLNPKLNIHLPELQCIEKVEAAIDKMAAEMPPLNSFILPGGNIPAANCNITRCVCRRAERNVLRLKETEEIPGIIIELLNRLSDYFFILSRKISYDLDNKEIKWPKKDM
jgi:cob(I)alamin adenosyltransferase